MNNVNASDIIELSVLPWLPGTSGPKLHGRSGSGSYLGSEYLCYHDDLTGAIRAFNLPTAVAPGEWHGDVSHFAHIERGLACAIESGQYRPHDGVTTDEDPRGQGEACDCRLVMRRAFWCEDCLEADRARWGHD